MKNTFQILFFVFFFLFSHEGSRAQQIRIIDIEAHRAYQDSVLKNAKSENEYRQSLKNLLKEYRYFETTNIQPKSNVYYYIARLYDQIFQYRLNRYVIDSSNGKIKDLKTYISFKDSARIYSQKALSLDSNSIRSFYILTRVIYWDWITYINSNQTAPFLGVNNKSEFDKVCTYIVQNALKIRKIDTSLNKRISQEIIEYSYFIISYGKFNLNFNKTELNKDDVQMLLLLEKICVELDKFNEFYILNKSGYFDQKVSRNTLILQAKNSLFKSKSNFQNENKPHFLEGIYTNNLSRNMGGLNISMTTDLEIFKENNTLKYKISRTTIDEYNGNVPRVENSNGILKLSGTNKWVFLGGSYGESGGNMLLTSKNINVGSYITINFAPGRGKSLDFLKNSSPSINTNNFSNSDKESNNVQIGPFTWMTHNLDVSKFQDGTPIRQVKNTNEWLDAINKKQAAWMFYGNNSETGTKYGKIYNYYALIDKRQLAPKGYHIPSKRELESLVSLSNYSLKSEYEWLQNRFRMKVWDNVTRIDRNGLPYLDLDLVEREFTEGGSGDNSSGFNAMPGGLINSRGYSQNIGKEVGFWSSTSNEIIETTGSLTKSQYVLKITWVNKSPILDQSEITQGFYVRCVYGKSIEEIEIEQINKIKYDSLIKDSIERVNRNLRDSIYANSIKTNTVRIGSQVWMTVNLDTDTFRNGEKIFFAKNRSQWDSANKKRIAACCYYGFDMSKSKNCGKLYNWYAVNDPRGLAPVGWSVPSSTDWKTLEQYVGENEAGEKLKSKRSWAEAFIPSEQSFSYRKNGTDEFGFNCLHCGNSDGSFGNAIFWSKTSLGVGIADVFMIHGGLKYVSMDEDFTGDHGDDMVLVKSNGLSVRCVKDK